MFRAVCYALTLAFLGCCAAHATTPSLLVLDIELTGDVGGPELADEHQARMRRESGVLRSELASTDRYRIIDVSAAEAIVARMKSQYLYLHDCNGCELQIGQAAHADQVLISWVNRVSALILTLTYEIHDALTGKLLARESFDFRGDNDAAWTHAIRFMVRHLPDQAAGATRPTA